MSTPEPLWKVMHEAQEQIPWTYPDHPRRRTAAELRAIATWIRGRHPLSFESNTYIGAHVVAAELMAEADRVEGA